MHEASILVGTSLTPPRPVTAALLLHATRGAAHLAAVADVIQSRATHLPRCSIPGDHACRSKSTILKTPFRHSNSSKCLVCFNYEQNGTWRSLRGPINEQNHHTSREPVTHTSDAGFHSNKLLKRQHSGKIQAKAATRATHRFASRQ